jgi:hypothetical protein
MARPMRMARSEFWGNKLRHILCETGKSHCKRKNVKSVPEVKKKNCSRGVAGSVNASGCSVNVNNSTDIVVSVSLASCVTTY